MFEGGSFPGWSFSGMPSNVSRDAAVVEAADIEGAAGRAERIVVGEADARQIVDRLVDRLTRRLALDEFGFSASRVLTGVRDFDAGDIGLRVPVTTTVLSRQSTVPVDCAIATPGTTNAVVAHRSAIFFMSAIPRETENDRVGRPPIARPFLRFKDNT